MKGATPEALIAEPPRPATKTASEFLSFVGFLLVFEALCFAGFFKLVEYLPDEAEDSLVFLPPLQNAALLLFAGLAFLLTFAHGFGLSAVGLNFFAAFISLQTYILVRPFARLFVGDSLRPIVLRAQTLFNAVLAASAVVVALGAVLGRVNIRQTLVITLVGTIIYTIAEVVLDVKIGLLDIGGGVIVYLFGAIFGLAIGFFLPKFGGRARVDVLPHRPSPLIFILAIAFIWVLLPNVVGARAEVHTIREIAIVNAWVSLFFSGAAALLTSYAFNKARINTVDLPAVFAGGVASAIVGPVLIQPVYAAILGALAGTVAVLSNRFLDDLALRKLGDTLGASHFFAVPALLGGLLSAAAALARSSPALADEPFAELFADVIFQGRSRETQAQIQAISTLVVAIVAAVIGAAVGFAISRELFRSPSVKLFSDAVVFVQPEPADVRPIGTDEEHERLTNHLII